jgi:hypothetical protein
MCSIANVRACSSRCKAIVVSAMSAVMNDFRNIDYQLIFFHERMCVVSLKPTRHNNEETSAKCSAYRGSESFFAANSCSASSNSLFHIKSMPLITLAYSETDIVSFFNIAVNRARRQTNKNDMSLYYYPSTFPSSTSSSSSLVLAHPRLLPIFVA